MITPNLGLNIPDFDASPWHDLVNNNFKSIDAIVHTMFGITNVKGIYANSTAVNAGDRYVDPVTTELYEVVTGYVTAPAPTTFSADRALNPANWLLVDASAALNGLAQMLTIRSEVLAARDEVNNDQATINTIVASLHMPAVATIGGTPITITDWDNAKNYPNTVVYAASAASLLPSGFEFGVAGSPGRAGLGFYYSLDANNGYIIIVALASGNRWYRRYEGGIWQPWSKNPNMNEIVRRDFQLTGNAETSVDAATTQGADFYKIAAGASNLPSWASIGDVMLSMNTGVSDGSLLIVGRNGRIAAKGKSAGVWANWQEYPLPSEIVRKGLTIAGDINTLLTGGVAGYTDVYTLAAGFSNAPAGAAIGDKIINSVIDATNGMQLALLKAGGLFTRTFNANTFGPWIDVSRRRFISAQTAYSNGQQLTIPHGLGAVPNNFDLFAVCLTAQSIIQVGQRVKITSDFTESLWADATNVYVQVPANGFGFSPTGFGAATFTLTAANFRVLVTATL